MSTQPSIGFIGGGNMATAIIHGLVNQQFAPDNIHVADPSAERRKELSALNNAINTYEDGSEIPSNLDAIVLAVKPQIMRQVVESLAPRFDSKTLFISIAAGVPMDKLASWLALQTPIVRCMPNTPSLVGLGTSGLYANKEVSATQRQATETIFNSVGISFWLKKESDIDSIIAVSGSGPAYFFYMMECMQNTAQELGLSPEIAEEITIQTALGAATLAKSSNDKPATLRENVTSKGGTTEAALAHMQEQNFSAIIQQAMQAAVDRAAALSNKD